MGRPEAQRHLQDQRAGGQPFLDLPDRTEEIGPLAVKLVDQRDPWHAVFVGLSPDGFALGLDPLAGGKHHDRPVEHPQAPLHLGRKIDMPRRVNQVHRDILPAKRHRGGIDRDPPLLLLGIEVGGRGAAVHVAEPMARLCEKQQPLGERGLARIDVGDDPDVANRFQLPAHAAASITSFRRCRCRGARVPGEESAP